MDGINFNSQKEIEEEILKCKNSPYYFATKYLTVEYKGEMKPFTTPLSEEEFNDMFKALENGEYHKGFQRRLPL